MKRAALIAAGVVAAVFCVFLVVEIIRGPTAPARDFEIRPYIDATLKDAGSAKFTDEHLYRRGVGREARDVLCGTVNAKNSFGAYAGSQRFIAWRWRNGTGGSAAVEPIGLGSDIERLAFDTLHARLCADSASPENM